LLFAVLGTGVAAIWQEMDLKKAFYLGIGLPSFIQLNINTAADLAKLGYTTSLSLASAYALESNVSIPGRVLEISPEGTKIDYSVVFYSPDKLRQEQFHIKENTPVRINVPDYATSFAVRVGKLESSGNPLPQQPHTTITKSFTMKKSSWSGFLQAIGITDAPKYKVKLNENLD
jgi:hypothetical protein